MNFIVLIVEHSLEYAQVGNLYSWQTQVTCPNYARFKTLTAKNRLIEFLWRTFMKQFVIDFKVIGFKKSHNLIHKESLY